MTERKSFAALSNAERDAFMAALLHMKKRVANPNAEANEQICVYDQFVALHGAVMRVRQSEPGAPWLNFGHGHPGFLPWHRELLLRFERELQVHDTTVALPYWDWAEHEATDTKLFQDNFLGSGERAVTGLLAYDAPSLPQRPRWYPDGLEGFRIHTALQERNGTSLVRRRQPVSILATEDTRKELVAQPNLRSFWAMLEQGVARNAPVGEQRERPTHNFGHRWVGGHMAGALSPNDPVFFLHHCNVDRLWDQWQTRPETRGLIEDYEVDQERPGEALDLPMWPWVGDLGGYEVRAAHLVPLLADYSGEAARTPRDVLDLQALDYTYQLDADA